VSSTTAAALARGQLESAARSRVHRNSRYCTRTGDGSDGMSPHLHMAHDASAAGARSDQPRWLTRSGFRSSPPSLSPSVACASEPLFSNCCLASGALAIRRALAPSENCAGHAHIVRRSAKLSSGGCGAAQRERGHTRTESSETCMGMRVLNGRVRCEIPLGVDRVRRCSG
jgi:hypothetical protein